jgi:UDP-glucose 4-epimerase
VLVTGGLGFIGSNLAIRLVELGARVTVVDSLVPGHGGNRFNVEPIAGTVEVNVSDVRDELATNQFVRSHDVIFSLAGQVSHIDSMVDPVPDLEINCRSQLVLLEACRRHNPGARLVYAASRQQYGRPRYLPVDEDHPLDPIDVNGVNKIAGESYFLLYHRVYGMQTSSLRLTNTYGPRMQIQHARQGFVPWFVRLALEGKQIALYGDGSQLRDFNEVGDVVEAFLLAGADPRAVGRVYNLGHPEPASLLEFVEVLLDVAGQGSYELAPFPPERERIDIGNVYADYGRIHRELGWEPRVGLREGLTRMVEYYRENWDRYA